MWVNVRIGAFKESDFNEHRMTGSMTGIMTKYNAHAAEAANSCTSGTGPQGSY